MHHRISAVTLAAAIAATFITAATASAETWKVTLRSTNSALKIDVYDAVANKSLGSGLDLSGGRTFNAEAKKGGGWEADKIGGHIRYRATRDGRCWTGQVCPTRDAVSKTMGPFPDNLSLKAGNCTLEGSSPACGQAN
jgi:hypothetical protein